MHELSLSGSLLDLVLEHCARAEGEHITDVHLVVGELANVMDDSLQFYWNIVTEDTAAAASQLHFRRVPLRFECRDCGVNFERGAVDFRCPKCAGTRVRVVAGDEFHVEAIDLEFGHRRPRADECSPRTSEPQI